VYIYAFPVQQMLAVASPGLSFWGFAIAAWLLTLPLAALSWWVVEKPALTLRRLVS
jgi:peptidoglycan/LPS O-acetylase OafA/YrhL